MMAGSSAGIPVHEEIVRFVADNVLFVSGKLLLLVNIHGKHDNKRGVARSNK